MTSIQDNKMTDAEILAGAPCPTWVAICDYDYGDCLHPLYLNCENQFYDEEEKSWVDMCLVDNYFHSFRARKDIERIVALEAEYEKLSECSDRNDRDNFDLVAEQANRNEELQDMLRFLVDNDSINDSQIDKEVLLLLKKGDL